MDFSKWVDQNGYGGHLDGRLKTLASATTCMPCKKQERAVSPSLLSLALLLQVGIGVGADPLSHACTCSENFSPNGTYASNLSKLLANLYFKTTPTGFGVDMVGQYSQNQVNGLALCHGDYSDRDFIGKIDNQNKFYLVNVNNASNPTTPNRRAKQFLSYLWSEAHIAPKTYAAGELELGGSDELYGLVQCTKDLSSSDCQKCLDDVVSEIPSCCKVKQGGPRLQKSPILLGIDTHAFITVGLDPTAFRSLHYLMHLKNFQSFSVLTLVDL
ncbi:Gnk2-homologous domain [Dillenia turbinata]|uniref:Gnk2-homologous domain n=1 Tax=Dillenia turbinata TaxID=194707 RepID=A0AAN8UTK1_9MAGN